MRLLCPITTHYRRRRSPRNNSYAARSPSSGRKPRKKPRIGTTFGWRGCWKGPTIRVDDDTVKTSIQRYNFPRIIRIIKRGVVESIRRGHSYAACFESAWLGRGVGMVCFPVAFDLHAKNVVEPGIIGTDTLLFQQNSRIRTLFLTSTLLETDLFPIRRVPFINVFSDLSLTNEKSKREIKQN